jgi:peptide/nickel transport system ATP-binding protein
MSSFAAAGTAAALEVRDLDVSYRVARQWRPVLRDVSFHIERGGSLGLVGESGCGKSTAAMAVVRHLARNGRVERGNVLVDGVDVYGLNSTDLRSLRARNVSMVYQSPVAALNPSMRVGAQVAEVFRVLGDDKGMAGDKALDALRRVAIADPGKVMQRYPHQLSGGMAQRVVIAMALANDPSLLILDEPTTGLDATVEAEILELVDHLRAQTGTAVLFISHNLGVIRKMCSEVGVLYAGRLVEHGRTEAVFAAPRHPYTVGLLRCIPRAGVTKAEGTLDVIPGSLPDRPAVNAGCVFADRCQLAQDRCHHESPELVPVALDHTSRCFYAEDAPTLPRAAARLPADVAELPDHAEVIGRPVVVQVKQLDKTFVQDGHTLRVLRDVNLELRAGETLGLVGESGSGKTTLAKAIIGMHAPDQPGSVLLSGTPAGGTVHQRTADQVRSVQMVFQNPDSALNPTYAVRRIIGRALYRLAGIRGKEARERTVQLTRAVQLSDRYLEMTPSQLSGGLKQRVAIARAFAGAPSVVVCDEPTSALDVSVQAAILNLLVDLQQRNDVAYLFISHDLGVVRYVSDRIAVLYLGEILEVGTAQQVFDGPHHPYTEALLSAVSSVDGDGRTRIRLDGEIPSASELPPGCVFASRCQRSLGQQCNDVRPPQVELEPGHVVRCHLPVEQLGRAVPVQIAPARLNGDH